jgi:hypothetical protein
MTPDVSQLSHSQHLLTAVFDAGTCCRLHTREGSTPGQSETQ